jgi:hypothetical protein
VNCLLFSTNPVIFQPTLYQNSETLVVQTIFLLALPVARPTWHWRVAVNALILSMAKVINADDFPTSTAAVVAEIAVRAIAFSDRHTAAIAFVLNVSAHFTRLNLGAFGSTASSIRCSELRAGTIAMQTFPAICPKSVR